MGHSKFYKHSPWLIFLAFVAVLLAMIFVRTPKADAIAGATTGFYPEVDTNGTNNIDGLVQIIYRWEQSSNGNYNYDTKMKGLRTVAAVYVPSSLRNQTINITIIGGCDTDGVTGRDTNGWNGNTMYRVAAFGGTVTADGNCQADGSTVNYSFTATEPPINIPGSRVYEANETYYVYDFIAEAVGSENLPRYLNAFQLRATTPGVFLGVSTRAVSCPIAAYPISCPSASLAPPVGQPAGSWAYSSFIGDDDPSSMTVSLNVGCSGGRGQIFIYDLDGEDPTLGQTLAMSVRRNGVVIASFNHSQILALGGVNNQAVHLPSATGFYPFDAGALYQLTITGLSVNNALQVLPNFDPAGPSGTCDGEPTPANDATCNTMRYGIGNFGPPSDPVPPSVLAQDGAISARPGQTVMVRMQMRNTGTNTWVEGGTNPYRLAQNSASAGSGTYNRIYPTNIYVDTPPAGDGRFWARPPYTPPDSLPTAKSTDELVDYYYVFTVPAYGANNTRDVSYRMYQGGVGGAAWFGSHCRWRLNILQPLPDIDCSMQIVNLSNPGEPIQPGEQIEYQVTVTNSVVGSTANSSVPAQQVTFTGNPAGASPLYVNTVVNYGIIVGGGPPVVRRFPQTLANSTPIGPLTGRCNAPGSEIPDTVSVSAAPYVKTFGNDVFTGAAFAQPACAVAPPGDIITRYGMGISGPAGSGAQLAVRALGVIHGFQPAALEDPDAQPWPLSFANSGAGVTSTAKTATPAIFGGNFGGVSCAPDYWADSTRAAPNPGNSIPASDGMFISTGSINLPGILNFNNRTSLFIDGDVLINSDITYQLAGWTSPETIPAFELIVRGNIYIKDDVTRLDGFYVAQPNGAVGGNIYTCSRNRNGPTTIAADEAFFASSCERQLVVNGAFAAKKIHFFRTASFDAADRARAGFAETTRRALPQEPRTSSKAAEVFIFGPEMYLARWATERSVSGLPFTSMLSLAPSF